MYLHGFPESQFPQGSEEAWVTPTCRGFLYRRGTLSTGNPKTLIPQKNTILIFQCWKHTCFFLSWETSSLPYKAVGYTNTLKRGSRTESMPSHTHCTEMQETHNRPPAADIQHTTTSNTTASSSLHVCVYLCICAFIAHLYTYLLLV